MEAISRKSEDGKYGWIGLRAKTDFLDEKGEFS